jgi:hypothetical protein
VTVKRVTDPTERYLDDARAIARTGHLPETVRAAAVAGLCRGAIEAACVDVVRLRELSAGRAHEAVEHELEKALHSLQDTVALTLFGDTSRAGEVPRELRERGGSACANAFWDAKTGVHDPGHGDLKRFVADTERLTKMLRS